MNVTKVSQRVILGVVVMVLALGTSSCKRWQVDQWVDQTHELQKEVLLQSEQVPYRKAQHEAIRAYFAELVQKASDFKEGKYLTSTLNWYLDDRDFNLICQKILISTSKWNEILNRCQRNNFFLCADEVKAYQDAITAVKQKLSSGNLAAFNNAVACQQAVLK